MDQVRNILASVDIVIWIVNGKHGKHAQRKTDISYHNKKRRFVNEDLGEDLVSAMIRSTSDVCLDMHNYALCEGNEKI